MSSKKPVQVGEVMTRSLISFKVDMDIYVATDLLLRHEVSGGPVFDEGGSLQGVLSKQDCIRALTEDVYDDLAPDITVGKLMTKNPETIEADRSVMAAAEVMANRTFGRLFVVDRKGDLVGLITRTDVLLALRRMGKDRYLKVGDDPTQKGDLIHDKGIGDMVGPETNKRFG